MLEKSDGVQDKLVLTTLEALMPKDHFLRDLDRHIDFSFIYDKLKHLYSQTGRPAIDPVKLIKMLLIGFLYGIDSERKLEREIEVNIAYRWFVGIDFDQRVPDHSTISQTRRRKLKNTNIFEEIFVEIVKKCISAGLVDGELLLTDSTHVKASASKKRAEMVRVNIEPSQFMQNLEQACQQEAAKKQAEADENGKKTGGSKPKETEPKTPKTKEIKISLTDPDCGYMNRPEKPTGFHHLSHQTTDGKSGIITDVFVTAGNVCDHSPYAERIKHQIETFGFEVQEVGLDRGYDYPEVHKEMHDLGIKTYTPLINRAQNAPGFPQQEFEYEAEKDCFVCPAGKDLKYSTINQTHKSKVYRASQKDCKNCPLRAKCIGTTAKTKSLMVSFYHKIVRKQHENCGTKRYFEVQKRRRIYCEGNFALQKELHNLRSTRKRGNANVTEHCLMSAMALNLKRLVKYLCQHPFFRRFWLTFPHFCAATQAA